MMDDAENPLEIPEEELARLADGSLPPDQRDRLAAAVAGSPRLTETLGEQQRAVAMMSSLRSVQAPATLRARLAPDPAPAWRPPFALTRWRALRPALATALALVLVLIVTMGRGAPTMTQAVNVALAHPAAPPPPADPARPGLLRLSVDGIAFPAWTTLRWSATGSRSESIGDRTVRTVYYSGPEGYRVGYAIVSGAALPVPRGRTVWAGGVSYTVMRSGDEVAVTWRRAGHTCVIAGRGPSASTLLMLARDDAA